MGDVEIAHVIATCWANHMLWPELSYLCGIYDVEPLFYLWG